MISVTSYEVDTPTMAICVPMKLDAETGEASQARHQLGARSVVIRCRETWSRLRTLLAAKESSSTQTQHPNAFSLRQLRPDRCPPRPVRYWLYYVLEDCQCLLMGRVALVSLARALAAAGPGQPRVVCPHCVKLTRSGVIPITSSPLLLETPRASSWHSSC
jgi:hypothetical protein